MDKNFFASLIDSCVDGRLTFDDLTIIKQNIESKNGIAGWYAQNAFLDLATLRYRFTMEVLISTILFYLTKPRSTSKRALKNFKLANELLEFVIKETQDLIKREKEGKDETKPNKKKKDQDDQKKKKEEGDTNGTNS